LANLRRAGGGGRAVVEAYYEAMNNRDWETLEDLLDEDCTLSDWAMLSPFKSKRQVRAYFERLARSAPRDVVIQVEDITDGRTSFGVQSHFTMGGAPLPLTRMLSLISLSPEGKVLEIVDSAENMTKVGELGMSVILRFLPAYRLSRHVMPAFVTRILEPNVEGD